MDFRDPLIPLSLLVQPGKPEQSGKKKVLVMTGTIKYCLSLQTKNLENTLPSIILVSFCKVRELKMDLPKLK